VKERAGIQSVEVGYTLLQALGQAAGPLMLRDLAAAAGMSAAKAHRYLVSFQRLGLVTQDTASTRYDLGPSALRLGLASLSRLDAVKLARESLPSLMAVIEHTLALAVWGNRGPTVVHWEESPHAITVNLRLGDVMPLLTSATGLCFAAYMARDAIAPLLREEMDRARRQGRQDVPTTMDGVDRLLAEVRARGIARVVDTLLPGVVGFCAPVFDADAHLALGIVTMGPTGSFDTSWDGAVAAPLTQTARRLSADLGCRT
jgi:DNA-binding IclR family transcriptional regulator